MPSSTHRHRPASALSIDEFLAGYPPMIRDIAHRMAALIRATVPEATETVQPAWRSINYRHPVSGYFCGIFPRQETIHLIFEFGVLLPDPDALLQGDGKQVRYIAIREETELRAQAIQQMLRAAIDLPPSRAAKMSMMREHGL